MKFKKSAIIKLIIPIALLTFLSFTTQRASKTYSFSEIPHFQIIIEHFFSSEGEMLFWYISKDSVKIHYNCDFEDCRDTILYSSAIDTNVSEQYFNELLKIPLNRLEKKYDYEAMSDGLMETIKILNLYPDDISIYKHGIDVSEIESLYVLTDSLILNKSKLKISHKQPNE